MFKKLFYFSTVSIFILALFLYTWHIRHLVDLPDMDLSLDFALVDGHLVFCAKDGVYAMDVANPQNRRCLVSYPRDYLATQPSSGKPFIYMENNLDTVTLTYWLFHYLEPSTIVLNRAIATDQPAREAAAGIGAGLYREFETNQVFASFPHSSPGNAIWVTAQNGELQCQFEQAPYYFAYRPSGPSSRLFQYQNQLYCFVHDPKRPSQANLYQLDCTTGDFQQFIDSVVGDFVVKEHHLYYIAQGTLYHCDLDTGQCTELTAAQMLTCTRSIDDFLNHSSWNHAVSLIASDDDVFYVNSKGQLCALSQSQPLYQETLCFLQQQSQYIIAVLQNKYGRYRTVVLDAKGQEIFALPILAKVAVDLNHIFYTNGKQLYHQWHN